MMAKLPWKPWHEVVRLRDDLRSGELPMHMFAADLYEVLMQRGQRPVYERPEEFFALTFPTFNLRRLVREVVLRLAGKNDKAVRQLQLTYGGGKTHTLITLRHLVHDPTKLPKLPAVAEFVQEIGQQPPRCRVAGLCFDKLDVEKGMEVVAPDGAVRVLKQPWSVLAWQIAGEEGLKILHADNKAEERDSAPADPLLKAILELPRRDGLGTLVLIDEVLMYAREKVGQDPKWRSRLVNFFQYLTQAATQVDGCCIVASLLATDPRKSDTLGKEIQGDLYDIFGREREEVVEPVVKEDVAEVLRRRFFTPESLANREAFPQHVVAALKGIAAIDEETAKAGPAAEERFLRSYPFHPDLTEVLYQKWTQLARFQRTRGVLRTFALALREAEGWDTAPLVGAEILLSAPESKGLSDAMRELVTVADTEVWEGRKQAWMGILDSEFAMAKRIQEEAVGLKSREIEQAVVATFLHSQPIGQTARTRDLLVLLGMARPDKIELTKGLSRWAQGSYWLDDLHTGVGEGQLPGTWRLGNRPNLVQMHAAAAKNLAEDTVRARLIDEIGRTKILTDKASAAGVRVHSLPARPREVEDDGAFHYAVLGSSAASESGKPSAEARRFLDETTGQDRPRVYRNAVLLLVPSTDGLDLSLARVREYLAWEVVKEEIKAQQKEGSVDQVRESTLLMMADKAKSRISDAIRQAYCIVVTVSEKNEPQAFKITVAEESHFIVIKGDKRSRIQDTAITAEALLPGGPYALWKEGESSRRVKDLAGAFAAFPHLPKMLKASAILDTLAAGCEAGIFVLRLVRPDGTVRTWWMSRPDESALNDPALELLLPGAAALAEVSPSLLEPYRLPGLWTGDEIAAQSVLDYFGGAKAVKVERDGFEETLQIPKAVPPVVEQAIETAVVKGAIWLTAGPASLLGEPIPPGVFSPSARLNVPPEPIAATLVLPETLPDAWKDGKASALSIATALSIKQGKTLPWTTVRDVIDGAVKARFVEIAEGSHEWPCDFPAASKVHLRPAAHAPVVEPTTAPNVRVATAGLDPSQIQDLADHIPAILELKAKTGLAVRFTVSVEVGDGKAAPASDVIKKINLILREVDEDLAL